MSKKLRIRLILLVIVSLAFLSTFYFFFKNSRASGSPLKDKEYMEQLSTLSKRYNVAGGPVITPSPVPVIPVKKQNVIESISLSILNFLTNLIK